MEKKNKKNKQVNKLMNHYERKLQTDRKTGRQMDRHTLHSLEVNAKSE